MLATRCGDDCLLWMEGGSVATVVMERKFNTRIRLIIKVPQVEHTRGVATNYIPIIRRDVELDALIRIHVPLEEYCGVGQVPEIPL